MNGFLRGVCLLSRQHIVMTFDSFEWLLKEPLVLVRRTVINCLLAAGVLGDGLGAFTDCVLGKLTRENKTNGRLDFTRCDGGLLVVVSKFGSFNSDALEDIVDEGVHDAHSFAGDTSIRMDLLHDFVDVDGIGFLSSSPSLLLVSKHGLLAGFLLALLFYGWFWRHVF